MIARELQNVNYPEEKYQALYDEYFKDLTKMREMNEMKESLLRMIRN
jgi:hypothetical protein